MVMSGSTMLLITSNADAPVGVAGSMSSILSHRAQVSVPPRRGAADEDDPDDADVGPCPGVGGAAWHAASTPSPATANPPAQRAMNCLRVVIRIPPISPAIPTAAARLHGDIQRSERWLFDRRCAVPWRHSKK